MRFKKNYYIFTFTFLIVLFLGGCISKNSQEANKEFFASVRIGGVIIETEVVENLEDQIKGLSGRKSLGEDKGMLFVYDEVGIHTFWMEDMKFPLDIVFIKDECHTNDANLMQITRICECEVVDFVENLVAPKFGEEPASYTSKEEANYVLEVNAGFVAEHGIKIGNKVDISL